MIMQLENTMQVVIRYEIFVIRDFIAAKICRKLSTLRATRGDIPHRSYF